LTANAALDSIVQSALIPLAVRVRLILLVVRDKVRINIIVRMLEYG